MNQPAVVPDLLRGLEHVQIITWVLGDGWRLACGANSQFAGSRLPVCDPCLTSRPSGSEESSAGTLACRVETRTPTRVSAQQTKSPRHECFDTPCDSVVPATPQALSSSPAKVLNKLVHGPGSK